MNEQSSSFHIWEGIHSDFDSAPSDTEAFENPKWLTKSVERARNAIAESRANVRPSCFPVFHDYPLPVTAALCATPSEKLRILDYGGALGLQFLSVISALPQSQSVAYFIVERPEIVDQGKLLFADEPRLVFSSVLPPISEQFDIVHAGSVLQYCREWTTMLRSLAERTRKYLVLSDVPAGPIPTFVGRQNFYGSQFCHWFWNIDEFIGAAVSNSLSLKFLGRYEGAYLGKVGSMPMDNYPPEYRLENSCNLILQRI